MLAQTCWSLPDWLRLTEIVVPDCALYDAAAPTSLRRPGRRQLTLIDGKTERTERTERTGPIFSVEVANLWLACCKMYFCNRNWVWKESLLYLFFPWHGDWSDMNVSRKFQSWKPGMQNCYSRNCLAVPGWQISAGLSPVIAMLTLSSSPL